VITTEAWVLHRGPSESVPGELKRTGYSFPDLEADEVLAEPLYGCWEGNMTHALERRPIDVCRHRGEDQVVLGNAGVVRVLKIGARVSALRAGDICGLISAAELDPAGYPKKILAYDAPGTMGVLARQMKLREFQLFRIPEHSRHSLPQWAAYTVRYATAWDNWRTAQGAWRLQMGDQEHRPVYVWGWGGGVGLGELLLAKAAGYRAALICSTDERIELCLRLGIEAIDRRRFLDLRFDQSRFKEDIDFRRRYMRAEHAFLETVEQRTSGNGVSIFIDNIGRPVYRATLNALGRQGVIATSGWKEGMELPVVRARECINRHIHVFTHGARYDTSAIRYAEKHGWLPPVDGAVCEWNEIADLAHAYGRGRIDSYFPVFRINPA